jgi:AcrR family transcriptional regulator
MNVRSEKKNVIFETTLKLIARHGLHNTPMSMVSKESGISTGAIYHHFESKDVLINKLYLFVKQEMLEHIFQNVDSESDFKAQFYKIWSNYYHYLTENPEVLSFVEQCSITPIIKAPTRTKAETFVAPLIDFIATGIREQILIDNEIELILTVINGNVVALAKLYMSEILDVNMKIETKSIEISWKGLAR